MKPASIGNINACGIAIIYEGTTQIATCMNTPNNIAAAFRLYPNGTSVKASYTIKINNTRSDYIDRFNGLDMEYHSKFISTIGE